MEPGIIINIYEYTLLGYDSDLISPHVYTSSLLPSSNAANCSQITYNSAITPVAARSCDVLDGSLSVTQPTTPMLIIDSMKDHAIRLSPAGLPPLDISNLLFLQLYFLQNFQSDQLELNLVMRSGQYHLFINFIQLNS
jgi:hypothetical protein